MAVSSMQPSPGPISSSVTWPNTDTQALAMTPGVRKAPTSLLWLVLARDHIGP